jgi:hypothetical protein
MPNERGPNTRFLTLASVIVAIGLSLAAEVRPALAQKPAPLPFFVGEEITYRIRSSRVGSVGQGRMWIDDKVDVRGTATWLLRFDVNTRVGPVKAVNQTQSWLDPLRMAALRFQKHEQHPLSKHDEDVEIYPSSRRWSAANGTNGESPTELPLDELSFMYFVRTLPLDSQTTFSFNRHFEMDRNPISVQVVGREVVKTRAGDFRTFIVEMRVRDPRRYRGEGVIRLNISDDECRLLVRIESSMPVLGTAVLTLESHSHPKSHLTALVD